MIEFDRMGISKNYLVLISLLTSIIGLILIYLASVNLEPQEIQISDITADMEGRKLLTTGHLTEKRVHENGHLFLTISDDKSKLQVPLFSDFMKNLNQKGITKDDFDIGDKISVQGTLENYKGTLQIIPKSLDDVKILGD